eukprot:TRINITY_DN96076_c0_g1_i1.p1 TRINITY_DN96076_c0_g1~~TRINITY_DN96076_c0_g1_i1.p1  ORF type:complete len:287 (-),score=34.84 TRINITY_DN96076_c0_g1_i1:35-895(-)
MPTLFDRASKVLRNAVIITRREAGPRDCISYDHLAKLFRRSVTKCVLHDGDIIALPPLEEIIKPAPQTLTERFIHSHHMDRYVMFVAWFCFWQTLLQLSSCVFADAFYDGDLMANVAYTLFYASFLLIYLAMEPAQLPSSTYIAGIALYTAGYTSFALWAHFSSTDDTEVAWVLYNVGAWCFVIGSAALIYGLMPVMAGDARPSLKDLLRCPGCDGSFLFLVGSLVFASDAAGFNFFLGYDSVVGYSIFLIGRVFFVQASVTEWCGVCFQRGHGDSEDSHLSAALL